MERECVVGKGVVVGWRYKGNKCGEKGYVLGTGLLMCVLNCLV